MILLSMLSAVALEGLILTVGVSNISLYGTWVLVVLIALLIVFLGNIALASVFPVSRFRSEKELAEARRRYDAAAAKVEKLASNISQGLISHIIDEIIKETKNGTEV